MRLPYLMSWHACTLHRSPSLTRRLFRATGRRDGRVLCISIASPTRRDYDSPLFIEILPSSTSSDERQMRTVSFLFLPLMGRCGRVGQRGATVKHSGTPTHRTMMVSPRNRPRVSIVAGLSVATELSSALDSSTIRRFGLESEKFATTERHGRSESTKGRA